METGCSCLLRKGEPNIRKEAVFYENSANSFEYHQ